MPNSAATAASDVRLPESLVARARIRSAIAMSSAMERRSSNVENENSTTEVYGDEYFIMPIYPIWETSL